jgi:hypothetical protein
MSRRAFLGKAASALGAALTRKAEPILPAQTNNIPAMLSLGPMSSPGSSALAEDQGRWDILRELTEARQRERMRKSARISYLGGYTPQTYSCHSWAPWFKAMVTERQISEMVEEYETFYEKMKRTVFGG